jgi:2-polyprenyl-3-methyl-5-hydroxy-6-metoxy-1,4-benzoquinol methylase
VSSYLSEKAGGKPQALPYKVGLSILRGVHVLHIRKQGSKEYLEEYKRRGDSPLGQEIMKERWRFISGYLDGGVLLDYGCGSGHFHQWAWRPVGFDTHGYDFNPHSDFKTPVPRGIKIDALTMWDVIEHLPDPRKPIVNFKPRWIFLSTPNIEAAPPDVVSFKHVKPGEHIYYFSRKSLKAFLWCLGYEVLETNTYEGALRDPACPHAIISVAAERMPG